MRNTVRLAGGLAVLLMVPEDAAATSATSTVRLQAHVPAICHIQADLSPGPPAVTEVLEFCNVPAGYRVYVSHPPVSPNVPWRFDYAGSLIPPSPGGETLLIDSDQPANNVLRELTVRLAVAGNRPVPLLQILGLRIEPK